MVTVFLSRFIYLYEIVQEEDEEDERIGADCVDEMFLID